jgi:hypothetical protein
VLPIEYSKKIKTTNGDVVREIIDESLRISKEYEKKGLNISPEMLVRLLSDVTLMRTAQDRFFKRVAIVLQLFLIFIVAWLLYVKLP